MTKKVNGVCMTSILTTKDGSVSIHSTINIPIHLHAHKYAHKTRKCISHTKQFVFRLIRNSITCLAVCFGSSLSSIVQHERSY